MILPIVFCLVCGVLLILFGNLALRITAYVLAGVMLATLLIRGMNRKDALRKTAEA